MTLELFIQGLDDFDENYLIATEGPDGIPFLRGGGHIPQVGKSVATDGVGLFRDYFVQLRSKLETPIALRENWFGAP